MDSNLRSSPHDNSETKNAFRRPSGDAVNRNYRRRSPIEGSSSPDGSPRHGRSSSPNPSRDDDSVRVSHHHSRKYDGREQDRHYGRNHYGRSESLRHSDRRSSRSSYGHSRNDKYADEDRFRERLSSRSGRESRGDHMREDSDGRSKDYQRSLDKYSRDKYERSGSGKRNAAHDEVEKERRTRDWDGRDERRDSHRSDRAVSYSESRSQKDDFVSQRDSSKYHLKKAYKNEQEELNGHNKDRNSRKVGEQFGIEDEESSGKKPKSYGANKDDNSGKDDERQTSSSKLSHESKEDVGAAKTSGFDGGNDLDAAKVAAMRAAELVNKNLVGAGCLTTDQKKKLLWGAKKSTPTEESGHRWDTGMFDRERQEKFNKLMGVKGEAKVEQNSNDQNGNAEKQKELQLDLEKQYTAGLRRRDGRTVGLGL